MTEGTAAAAAGAIDGSFVPRPNPAVTDIELDGERVLYDADSGWLYQLDAVGSLTWSCFDGEATLDELVTDLADAFGVDPAQVRADVVGLAIDLVDKGLLGGAGGADRRHGDDVGQAEDVGQGEDGNQPVGDGAQLAPRLLVDPPSG